MTNLRDRARTNCGTPAYAAPEVLIGGGYTYKADVWSFGILICEMLGGFTPFGPKAMEIGAVQGSASPDHNAYAAMPPNQIVEMANSGRLILPKNLTPLTRDLVKRILVPDPEVRLEIKDIMKHKFFAGLDWSAVERRSLDPPYTPTSFENDNLVLGVTPESATPFDLASDDGTLAEQQTTAATHIGRALNPILEPPTRKKVQSSLSTKSSPQVKRTTPKQILGDFHLTKINQVFHDF
mmetsp:Transcript_42065/g.55423  ORF Transcript_42065/g.55423 Transcript_42065/m.55423 type:complete len:238 (-) Transcript_42065:121-834(-)|eukprot:CAMPEP_0185599310 /NCGR_PEP_ID=MMETSP0434-20130131/82601_1 /TAXON_ID=626734 ORGANISM="Favella taraikaensis, Strain Fe Narragansett Bay" /NCGR_SAMPLE_ID=MMETSP0434 /ASSEMBLY_ACC=CAM_ASM_000379 /LENGTH=237 /DNA_ID=CAMNT_0028228637 /DNA_START=2314 /DNA_END=3027 /DNA_ORIENTATION=-